MYSKEFKVIGGLTRVALLIFSLVRIMQGSASAEWVTTLREKPELIPIITDYHETSLETVEHFLNHLAPSPSHGACSIRARYIKSEAQKVNLSLNETTVYDWDKERVQRTLCCGHRTNVFEYHGIKYYVTNLYTDCNKVVRYNELLDIMEKYNKLNE